MYVRKPSPAARNTDPETSHQGAADVKPRKQSQKDKLLLTFAKGDKLLPNEAAAKAKIDPGSCYWKRISEMHSDGLLTLTGETRPGSMGSHRNEYEITLAGIRRVREIS